jgi:hypothetical protein
LKREHAAAALVSSHDQALAAAVEWWGSHESHDRRNLLRLLCDPRVSIERYRGLDDAALRILRDLAALALANIVTSSEEATEL